MLFSEIEIEDPAGFSYTMRSAVPGDAEAVAEFVRIMVTETDFLPWANVKGMQNPEYVKSFIINIIMSTGSYLEQYIDDYVRPRSVEELAADAVRDLTEGIDGTDVKADVIGEIAWSQPEEGPLEKKAWQAWVKAACETDAIVSTHPSRGIQQLPQAQYLIENGVKPERIVIGHVEFSPDDETLMKLLDTGVTIGLDMIGKESGKGDEFRADFVRKIKDWGRLRQLTLSLDICGRQQLRACGGYGYIHMFDTFIPMLRERGITDSDIDLILRQNPVRILMKKSDNGQRMSPLI